MTAIEKCKSVSDLNRKKYFKNLIEITNSKGIITSMYLLNPFKFPFNNENELDGYSVRHN